MCPVSEDMKLCTCQGMELGNAESIWVLYRYTEREEMVHIVGTANMPNWFYIESGQDEKNKQDLGTELNRKNCFDFEYQPMVKDRLALILKVPESMAKSQPSDREILHYSFEFKKGKWQNIEYDTLSWEGIDSYDELNEGKALNVFKD